jgi:hypothetical protein
MPGHKPLYTVQFNRFLNIKFRVEIRIQRQKNLNRKFRSNNRENDIASRA